MVAIVRRLGALYLLVAGIFVAVVLVCVLYVERDSLLVHYHVRRVLANPSGDSTSEPWLRERTFLALPVLLSAFAEDDADRCASAAGVVGRIIADHRDPANPEHSHLTLSVAAKLQQVYPKLSPSGRMHAVALARQILAVHLETWSPNVPTSLETAGDVMFQSLGDDEQVKERALAEFAAVWSFGGSDRVARDLVRDWQRRCYGRIIDLLNSHSAAIRSAAAAALAGAPFHEGDLAVAERLRDDDPAVRKSALVALARSAGDFLASDQKMEVIGFLHDADPVVREAAVQLLKNSGVSQAVVELAILMKHPSPAERAKVVSQAYSVKEIDPARWILELAQDPAPAVRLAVAKAASTSSDPALLEALSKMAETDPDLLVRDMSRQFMATRVARPDRDVRR